MRPFIISLTRLATLQPMRSSFAPHTFAIDQQQIGDAFRKA